MKKLVQRTALLLCVLMICAALPVFARQTAAYGLRVEGLNGCAACASDFEAEAGASALELFRAFFKAQKLHFADDGAQITEVGAQRSGAWEGAGAWLLVDGQRPVGTPMNEYIPAAGAKLVLVYADPAVLKIPYATARIDAEGGVIVRLTAQDRMYDDNLAPVWMTRPLEGVTVTVGGHDYITDAEGEALLSAADGAGDRIALSLEARDARGCPTVLPLAPGFELSLSAQRAVKFDDLSDTDAETRAAVEEMVRRGVIKGYPDGTFRPDATVTRAEAVTALARALSADLGAQPSSSFADVPAGAWHRTAVDWAASVGVTRGTGKGFEPNRPVTRQELAVMLVRFAELAQNRRLPRKCAAPAFEDAGSVANYAAESVYLLQKAGVLTDQTRFRPKAGATRAEFCVLLSRLLAV